MRARCCALVIHKFREKKKNEKYPQNLPIISAINQILQLTRVPLINGFSSSVAYSIMSISSGHSSLTSLPPSRRYAAKQIHFHPTKLGGHQKVLAGNIFRFCAQLLEPFSNTFAGRSSPARFVVVLFCLYRIFKFPNSHPSNSHTHPQPKLTRENYQQRRRRRLWQREKGRAPK